MTAPPEVKCVDRGLIERAQDGDRDAYEQLARACARRLYGSAYRIVRDRDRADDAVQQVLIAIWRDVMGLRDPDRFDAWTYRLIVRTCLAETRRPRRLRVTLHPLAEDVAVAHDDTADAFAATSQSAVLPETTARSWRRRLDSAAPVTRRVVDGRRCHCHEVRRYNCSAPRFGCPHRAFDASVKDSLSRKAWRRARVWTVPARGAAAATAPPRAG
jgi:RNA polymerase sigma factor (sigma-70 family)